jgi:glycerol uptake facilitator-like aquaporin/protein-tyrosine-phosphatase
MTSTLSRRVIAEFVGTAFLVAAVIGSGVMAERLSAGNVAIALLANSIATGAALVAIILAFGGISGAHFNPAVSISDMLAGGLSRREAGFYITAQFFGGLTGTAVAHLMFSEPVYSLSQHQRHGIGQLFSEFVAAFGLMAVIWGCSKSRTNMVPFAVAAYITAAYWFTASTSFANPAVTLARAFSNTFAGIRLQDVPGFVVAQFGGALAATWLFRWLLPDLSGQAQKVLIPHPTEATEINTTMRRYIFACVHNAGRSQMAAAFFNLYAQPGCEAISAGTAPAPHVHPEVVSVMKEIGIDLSAAKPQRLTEELASQAHVLVTMGCGEACPFVPGLRVVDWSLPDPKGQPLDAVRKIRDQIHENVKNLLRDDCAGCCADLTKVPASQITHKK